MARTRKSARRVIVWQRCELLQLMGFSAQGDSITDAAQLQANWPTVVERLASHPNEALFKYEFHQYPLRLALANKKTPITRDAFEAFVKAYPRALQSLIDEDSTQAATVTDPAIIDAIEQAKRTYVCGQHRTRTFQLMGFPISCEEETPGFHFEDFRGVGPNMDRNRNYHVDWLALESHLEKHPKEAKIMCPVRNSFHFPLEVAVRFAEPPMPLSILQLLLRLYPDALAVPDSPALYFACSVRQREDPTIIRAILRANPALAAAEINENFKIWDNIGLPIHEAVRLPCAAEIMPELIQAHPPSLAARTDMWFQIPLQVAAETWGRFSNNVCRILLEYGHRHGACADHSGGQLFFVDGESQFGADNLQSAMDIIMETPGVSEYDELWQNLHLALQAAGAFRTGISVDAMWEYPLLHAAVEFGRRKKFIFERVYRHTDPRDRKRVDALGRTPLAVAIETAKSEQNTDMPWDDEDEEDFLKLDTIFKNLLDDWPQSASIPIATNANVDTTPTTTTLPLHYSLHKCISLEDGSEHILHAFPEALSVPDPVTKLIPCLLAATVGDEGASINTIFGLMMRRPDLIIMLMK